MTTIIGVRFRNMGKVYYFGPKSLNIEAGDHVIVETARGVEYGCVVLGPREVEDSRIVQPLKEVIRIATPKDDAREESNRRKEKEAFQICQKKIAAHNLDMKLIDAEYTFDNNKVLFYFTADGRVDFRELVKDLASVFKTRIELRQIGVRDETKILGGIGICGRPLCCHTYLSEFAPVSIKMAKEQNLSLNPTKISGTCGRLMCCLKYEQEAYEDAVHRMPKQDSFVETPDGVGDVTQVDLLREQVKVRLDSAPEAPKCYHNCEICVVRNGKGKRPEGYVAPPPEELARRRYVAPREEGREELQREHTALSDALERVFQASEEAPAREQRRDTQESRGGRRGSRRRRGSGGGGEKKAQAQQSPAGKPAQDKPERKTKGERPPQPKAEAAPASGEQPKKSSGSRRNHRRRRGGGGGGQPKPPAPQGEA